MAPRRCGLRTLGRLPGARVVAVGAGLDPENCPGPAPGYDLPNRPREVAERGGRWGDADRGLPAARSDAAARRGALVRLPRGNEAALDRRVRATLLPDLPQGDRHQRALSPVRPTPLLPALPGLPRDAGAHLGGQRRSGARPGGLPGLPSAHGRAAGGRLAGGGGRRRPRRYTCASHQRPRRRSHDHRYLLDHEFHLGHRGRRAPRSLRARQVPRRDPADDGAATARRRARADERRGLGDEGVA